MCLPKLINSNNHASQSNLLPGHYSLKEINSFLLLTVHPSVTKDNGRSDERSQDNS